jgi:hypothetical protein
MQRTPVQRELTPLVPESQFEFERDAPPQVKQAFRGDVRRILLPARSRLWKWTDYDRLRPGPVTPWWAPLEPAAIEGFETMPGLQAIDRQLRARGGGPRTALRHALAVLPEWNSMGKLLIVALHLQAFVFAGMAAMQQMTDLYGDPTPIYLAGGFGQLFIPNLTDADLDVCDSREELLRVGIEDVELLLAPFDTATPEFHALQPKTRRLLKLLGLLTREEADET